MVKIFHEAPKSIFNSVQNCTDGDYALVHLFETDSEYFRMFKDAVASGREVILDNSVFELEKAFDPERFVYWINRLQPTYYIVPDVLEDMDGTVCNMSEWIGMCKRRVTCDAKTIGVVQGKDYEDLKRCYSFMNHIGVDKIAISFDYSYYQESYPHPNKLISWALGRVKLLGDFEKDGILNRNKPHHLLGCGTPGEGIFYCNPEFNYIDSIDTSNPVVSGLKQITYEGSLGMGTKPKEKLYTLINSEVSTDQWDTIRYNIENFRRLWRGTYGI